MDLDKLERMAERGAPRISIPRETLRKLVAQAKRVEKLETDLKRLQEKGCCEDKSYCPKHGKFW